MKMCKSDNVIRLHEVVETKNTYYLFLQYCNGGDLKDLLKLRRRFTEQEARYLLAGIVKGF